MRGWQRPGWPYVSSHALSSSGAVGDAAVLRPARRPSQRRRAAPAAVTGGPRPRPATRRGVTGRLWAPPQERRRPLDRGGQIELTQRRRRKVGDSGTQRADSGEGLPAQRSQLNGRREAAAVASAHSAARSCADAWRSDAEAWRSKSASRGTTAASSPRSPVTFPGKPERGFEPLTYRLQGDGADIPVFSLVKAKNQAKRTACRSFSIVADELKSTAITRCWHVCQNAWDLAGALRVRAGGWTDTQLGARISPAAPLGPNLRFGRQRGCRWPGIDAAREGSARWGSVTRASGPERIVWCGMRCIWMHVFINRRWRRLIITAAIG